MPSKLKTKYDYKCYYMQLANMMITHGSALCTAKGPEEVQELNNKAIAECRQFLSHFEEPKKPEIINKKV
tara:strand:- start:4393 stop:4602 length:210 start_codon:yes stop_codon:yes gene_type:complete